MGIRAGAYLRISRVADGTTLGVDRQLPPIEALFARKGWELVEVFCDNDLSAYTRQRRPDYERMVGMVRAGQLDALGAWHADRFTRRPVENETLIELAETHGVQLATVTGEHDLSTPSGRLHFRMLGAIARYESEHRSERIRLKMDELARAGLPKGGQRPFGFEADRVTHRPAEAAMIREATRRLLAGEGLHAILRDWDQRELTTSTGKRWKTTILRRILVQPRTAGLREHRGEVVGPATWDPIVQLGDWEQVRQVLLDDPARRRRYGPPRRYLLTGGLGRCGVCGEPIKSRPEAERPSRAGKPTPLAADGRRIYVRAYNCMRYPLGAGCGKISIRADPLEEFVAELVIGALAGDGLVALRRAAAGQDERRLQLVEQLTAEEAKLRVHDDDYDAGVLDRARWLRLTGSAKERIGTLRSSLDSLPTVRALSDVPTTERELREAWARYSLERRRALVGAVLEAVFVDPRPGRGRVFDPSRVRVVWRA